VKPPVHQKYQCRRKKSLAGNSDDEFLVYNSEIMESIATLQKDLVKVVVYPYRKQAGDIGEELFEDANNIQMLSLFQAAQKSSGQDNMFYHFVPLLPNPVLSELLSDRIPKKALNTDIVQIKQIDLEFAGRQCKLIIIKNLTELVHYQQIQMENRLYELFTATASHEMRNPLNSILTLLKVLTGPITDSKMKKTLRIIISSSEMLRYLVNDMLDIFAIKTDNFKREESVSNVREEVVGIIYDIFKEPCT
jgi:signal transduction histidine kinase